MYIFDEVWVIPSPLFGFYVWHVVKPTVTREELQLVMGHVVN